MRVYAATLCLCITTPFTSGLAAQTMSGPLSVGSSIPATCSIEPAGALSVVLNASQPMDSQSYGNVEINIDCQGGAVPQKVEFDDGLMEGFLDDGTTKARGMENAGNGVVIFYELVASYGLFDANPSNPNVTLIELDDSTDYSNSNWSTSNTDLVMHGRIVGAVDGSTYLATDSVPSGAYSDTVVMTLTFGAS